MTVEMTQTSELQMCLKQPTECDILGSFYECLDILWTVQAAVRNVFFINIKYVGLMLP